MAMAGCKLPTPKEPSAHSTGALGNLSASVSGTKAWLIYPAVISNAQRAQRYMLDSPLVSLLPDLSKG